MSEHKFCFWCDRHIPRIINEYIPCDKCKEIITKGIVIIEVQDIPSQINQPHLLHYGNYPTGTWFILNPGSIHKIFDEEAASAVISDRIAFLDRRMLEELGLRMKEKQVTTIQ